MNICAPGSPLIPRPGEFRHSPPARQTTCTHLSQFIIGLGLLAAVVLAGLWIVGFGYISHQRVGVIEELWSAKGSLSEGRYGCVHARDIALAEGQSLNLINPLVGLLISEKGGIQIAEGNPDLAELENAIADAQTKAEEAAKAKV